MYGTYGDQINFVGVAGRDDSGPIADFIQTFDVGSFPHVIDVDGSVWAGFRINTQPSFVFVNSDGTVETHVGALGVAGLSDRLDLLLAS